MSRTAGSPLEVSVMATLDTGSAFREEKMAVLEVRQYGGGRILDLELNGPSFASFFVGLLL